MSAEKPKQTPEEDPKEPEKETPEEPSEGTQPDPTGKKESPGEGLQPKEIDYKQKFGDSTRENQRILEENAELERKKTELETKLEESQRTLSEKELSATHPYWDDMTEEEKAKAREDFKKEKRLKILEAKEKWRDDYAGLPKETKEKLEKKGGEQAFKDFACLPENIGQKNLENLAKQFFYEEPKPEPPSEEPAKKPGVESGTGGPKTSITPKKGFTAEEAAKIRINEPKRYNQLVAEGRLKIID